MPKEFIAKRLDAKAFAEEAARLDGRAPLSDFTRLLAETQGRGAEVPLAWSAHGEIRNPRHLHPEVWLHLRAQVVLPLACQRCLEPVDTPVTIDRSFRFVADESIAESEDDEAEEDLLALSREFDLLALIEDEVLMDMPLVPRHEVCPREVPLEAADPDFEQAGERPNPFAVLGKLKGGQG